MGDHCLWKKRRVFFFPYGTGRDTLIICLNCRFRVKFICSLSLNTSCQRTDLLLGSDQWTDHLQKSPDVIQWSEPLWILAKSDIFKLLSIFFRRKFYLDLTLCRCEYLSHYLEFFMKKIVKDGKILFVWRIWVIQIQSHEILNRSWMFIVSKHIT